MEQTKNYESPEITVMAILETEQAFAGSSEKAGTMSFSIEEEEW